MPADSATSVSVELEAWCRPGGVLDKDGPRASINIFDPVPRRRTRDGIVEAYLSGQTEVSIGRQCLALATAGPPGVGKSSSVERRHLAGRGWRVLDADRVKDYLLCDALDAGVYDDLLARILPDGYRVLPRELATLVHSESTKLLDAITDICVGRGENVVLEGTFSWPGLGPRLLTDLASSGYDKFTILDVEAPADITRARALTRWWRGRVAAVGGGDPMGGRFTPGFVIDALYTPGSDRTICARNARAAFDHPLAENIPTVELLIEHLGGDDETWVKEAGVVVYSPATAQGPSTS
ncbi:zeta toxin family protein [Rhodococcus sp. BP-252]|uniref:zeta toxin family protein n=1 Tax=unclassified Rhodococcus (in: high G+C Gram-positive bacteria) TaxID=192944 RepID=UPI001C9B3454|nr:MULTISPECIES: zeta toxin family protein [unclassified Rhodococcus (in: high G+C Gram-positive bacteria)]MBY6413402.1 zeta toxin family protein [Rhodococcus sp. BP-320]MBY6417994.1 zeta toxin family protein [Rhodococcus sp. BP-321]MBY6422316.1 zeta toxin family protein [Rhodococcus sp. BP-324]MBY6428043.1 zeta toxin family protein [Rhodococcus sp. BP-323]MBY6433323.1 zeta toxin family protein [Rhodococcus sp. BP-322]